MCNLLISISFAVNYFQLKRFDFKKSGIKGSETIKRNIQRDTDEQKST